MWKTGQIGQPIYATGDDFASPYILPFKEEPTLKVNFSNLDFYKEQWQKGNNAILPFSQTTSINTKKELTHFIDANQEILQSPIEWLIHLK